MCFSCWFVGLQRWITVVNLWNLEIFQKRVRVCDSEPNLHGFARFYVVVEFVVVLERNKGVSWWFLPVFGSEIQPGSSEILVFDSVIDLWLDFWNETGDFSPFSFWTGSDSVNPSFPLLLEFALWSCRIRCFWRWIWRWNCRGMAQWWWFIRISESLHNFIDSACILFWKKLLGFMHLFLSFLILICNCQERESLILFVTGLWCGAWILTLCSGGLLWAAKCAVGQWAGDTWTGPCLRGFGLNWLILILRTNLQICKIWDCFAILYKIWTKIKTKMKRLKTWFWNAILKKVWTKMQFLKVLD